MNAGSASCGEYFRDTGRENFPRRHLGRELRAAGGGELVQLRATPQFGRAPLRFDQAAPLSQARVTVRLRDGRVVSQSADGARGYPGRLTDEELATKFAGCATRTLSESVANSAWAALSSLDTIADVRDLTALLSA